MDAVIFDDSVPAARVNIRSDRASNQSPIDNTKLGITDLGSKDSTVDPAATGATADYSTIGGGNDASATARGATVTGGEGCKATATWATAWGFKAVASGSGASARGGSTLASGVASDAGGNQCVASADYADASGSFCTGSGIAAFTRGQSCTASGPMSVAIGDTCTATNNEAVAIGRQCSATAVSAWARGILASAIRGQDAIAFGSYDGVTAGQAQTSGLVYRGTTPGAAPAEAVELLSGIGLVQTLLLEDGKSYTFVLTVTAGAVQAGPTRVSRGFVVRFNARRDAGLSVITAIGVGDSFGDAATADWTVVPTVGVAPDRIVLTFTTGAITSAANCVARVEMTETTY